MPYKIVETLEKGKNTLFFVPNNWEQNNILHWPKWKVESLLAVEDSYPDSSWHTMKCRVKRTGLVSKASAEAELANMCQKSDTETEESIPKYSKYQKVADTNNANSIQKYFDDISKTCTTIEYDKTSELQSTNVHETSTYVTCIPGPTQTNPTCCYVEENMISDLNIIDPTESKSDNVNEAVYVVETPQENSSNGYAELNTKIETLIVIAETLTQNQAVLMDHFKNLENKVLHKLSYLSAQIDSFATMSSKIQDKVDNVRFKCISNKEELQTFEKNLEKTEFLTEAKQHLLSVCGKGKGRGLSNAYTLADIMFTRQFLTECSWAGGSKNKIEKICFKSNSKTIDMFFEIVHESDKDFTKTECESFFKNIMRHAATRNKPEIKRAPSSKRRSQKILSKITNIKTVPNVNVNNQPTNSPTTVNQLTEKEPCESGFGDNVSLNNVNDENN